MYLRDNARHASPTLAPGHARSIVDEPQPRILRAGGGRSAVGLGALARRGHSQLLVHRVGEDLEVRQALRRRAAVDAQLRPRHRLAHRRALGRQVLAERGHGRHDLRKVAIPDQHRERFDDRHDTFRIQSTGLQEHTIMH